MAARPTWKGFIKISLVNIPVRVFPATDSKATISFNQLHRACGNRIQQKRWCPSCDVEVPNSDIVKGYEFEKGRYVTIDEDDISKARPESTRVINLLPDGQMAAEAFAVIREGMKGKAGIGKLALYGREYIVAVQPKEKGLVMYTLRTADEIRSMGEIDELGSVPAKVRPEEVKLAKQVISTFESALDLKEYKDEYQAELRRIIDAKVSGEEVVATKEEAPPKVVNLMEALRQSLDRVSTTKKKPARVPAGTVESVQQRTEEKAPAPKKRARG
jgi:DNA end-binding protein Ku